MLLSQVEALLWAQQKLVFPEDEDIHLILNYLLSSKTVGLSINSLRVHLVAIHMYHPFSHGYSIFIHPLTTIFLKGLIRTFPISKETYSLMGLKSCSFNAH